jgi:hypothetical protein
MLDIVHILRAHGSPAFEPLCYKPERRGVETRRGEWIYLILNLGCLHPVACVRSR